MRPKSRSRVEVQLPVHATGKLHRELAAFARYCINRLERELGEHDAWIVDIAPTLGGYTSHVAVHDRGTIVEDQGRGNDGTLAIWDAICRLEQRLRELRH